MVALGLMRCCCLVRDNKGVLRIKKGKYDMVDRVGSVRMSLRNTASFVIPSDVNPEPFGKRALFFVDVEKWMAVPLGAIKGLTERDLMDIKTKLELLGRNKFWRFLGGRSMDLMELLITLGAGYGFFRLVEVLIMSMFGKGG